MDLNFLPLPDDMCRIISKMKKEIELEDYIKENTYDVIATEVSLVQIHFECPLCVKKLKKNGEPYARSKPYKHHHGSDSLDNRIQVVNGPHCTELNLPKSCNKPMRFNVHITDDTVRVPVHCSPWKKSHLESRGINIINNPYILNS